MNDTTYFRREAERYRKLAQEESNSAVAQRMRDFSRHYDGLAELLDETETPAKKPQSKTEPEDKT